MPTPYELWLADQKKKKQEQSQGKINYREAAQASRPQYTLPGYQGSSKTQSYKWETDNLKDVKGMGRSYNDKFNNITKQAGMTPSQADEYRRSLDFGEDSKQKIKLNADGTPNSRQNIRAGQGAHTTDELLNGIFSGMNQNINQQIQENQAKSKPFVLPKNVSKDRPGILGFLDKTLGRIGNTANEMALGKGFNDAQNENYQKIAVDKLKDNPKDKKALQELQMTNTATRKADGKLEKASDFIGQTAGLIAPYTIGGAYGTAEKGLQILSKLKPVEKAISKPIMKDLVRGLGAGAIAGSERAAMHKGASNEKVSVKDIALESALAGGGDAALGAVLRNLNLKGHLNTALHESGTKKFNAEDFQKALHDTFGQKGDVSNAVADVPKTTPKPFQPKYQNLKLPAKTMNSFKTNDIPKVNEPLASHNWFDFASKGNTPIARGTIPKLNLSRGDSELLGKQADTILQRSDALKQDGFNQRLLDVQKEMKTINDKRGIYRHTLTPDELYNKVKQPNDPNSFDELIKLAEMEHNTNTAPVNIKQLLHSDPKIKQSVQALNKLGGLPKKLTPPLPDKPNIQTIDEMLGNGVPKEPTVKLPNGNTLRLPNLKVGNENPTAKVQDFLNSIKKNKPLQPGKDFLPIEQQKFGTKLARVETTLGNKFNFPYKPGDPLPDTLSHIGTKTEKTLPSMAEVANKGYIKTVDNLHRLSQFDNQVKNVLGRDLKPTESAHMLGLNSRGSDMISKQILTENMVNKNGDAIGQSLKDITIKVPKGKLKDFEDYLVNKHAITRMNRGEKVFPDEMQMSTAKSEAKVKQYEENHPEFKDIAKEYYDYNKQLGQHWLVDTGILSKDQWEGYLKANPHYVPNNRIFKDIERSRFTNNAKKGYANQSNPVKKAIGSQRKIVSPIESTIEHTAQYVKTAKRNEVMQTLINNIKQNPEAFKDWAEIVPTDKTPSSIMETLQKEGVDGVLENLNKGFDQKPDLSKGNIIRGLIDGKPVHVKVHDPHLLDALTNLSPKAQNIVIHSLGQVTRVMKNLTTGINPVFSLTRNIFRDIPTAYTNSKTTNNPFVFSKDLVQSVVSVFKNDELYRSFKAVGGGHASPVSSDVNLLTQSKRSILPQKGLRPLLGKGLGALENLNNAVEAAPRLAEFKRIAKNGDYNSKMKALYEANDVTVNFNKYGNVAKEIDSVVPYFNAAVQGLDKLGRVFFSPNVSATEKAIAGVKAFSAITIPSILLYTVNHNNPDYQKVSNYIKDTNFLIPKGDGTFFKIPKPRELGVIFGSDVERVLRAWNDNDPQAFQDFTTTLWDNFKPPVRTIIAPVNDLRANKNFMDAPIIPGDLQNVSSQYQYDSKTSEVSKKLGALFNFSPMKADYLAKSYLGFVGELGIPATAKDTTIGQTLKQKVTVDPVFSNDLQRRFYDMKTKIDQAHNDLTKQGVKNPNLNESLRKSFNKTSLEMGKVRKEIKATQIDKNLTPQQRLDKIRKLQDFINQMAAQAIK